MTTRFSTRSVVIGISGNTVIVKKISLPEMCSEELEESIHWEAEQYIPFDIEDVNLDFQIIESAAPAEEGRMDVILVAAKKEKVDESVSLVVQSGLQPMVVDLEAFALQNAFEVNYELEPGKSIALIDIGAGVMNINVIGDGVSVFTRDISIGGNQFTETIQKELNISYDQAEALKNGESVERRRPGHGPERHRVGLRQPDHGDPAVVRLLPGHGQRARDPEDRHLAAGRPGSRGWTSSSPSGWAYRWSSTTPSRTSRSTSGNSTWRS